MDFIILTQKLRELGELDKVGGAAFVTSLFTYVATAAFAESYIETLREYYVRRRIIIECQQRVEAAYNGSDDPVAMVEVLRESLRPLEQSSHSRDLSEVSEATFHELMAFNPREDADCLLGNRWLCRAGAALWIGQSGIGKSALTMQAAMTWAMGVPLFGIKPVRRLKSLIVQAENDTGDMAEMAQGVIQALMEAETPEMRAAAIEAFNREIVFVRDVVHTGHDFCRVLGKLIRKHKPDLVWIDPLSPSPAAAALGAKDHTGIANQLGAVDARIEDLKGQLAGEDVSGKINTSNRNRIAEQIIAAHQERQQIVNDALRSRDLHAAAEDIEAISPERPGLEAASPEEIEKTKLAARALVKIGTGQPVEALTAAERTVLEAPTPDGVPRVESLKGQPVITDGAIARLRELAPNAAALIRQSEAERRNAILNPEGEEPEGQVRPETPTPAPETEETAANGLYSVEVEWPNGTVETVRVEAESEEAAKSRVAGKIPAGQGIVREAAVIRAPSEKSSGTAAPTPAAPASEFAETAVREVEQSIGRVLEPRRAEKIRTIAKLIEPHYRRWEKAFAGIRWTVQSEGTAGAMLENENRLVISLADVLKHEREYQNPEMAANAISEEAIHAVTVALEARDRGTGDPNDPTTWKVNGPVNLVDLYRSLPEAVRDAVAGAYTVASDDYRLAHEFWRMWMQGELKIGENGFSIRGRALTESVNRNFIYRIRRALFRILAFFRDMEGGLRAQGASEDLIREVERAKNLIRARMKDVDALAPRASEEGNEEGLSTGRAPVVGETDAETDDSGGRRGISPEAGRIRGNSAAGESEGAAGGQTGAPVRALEPTAREELARRLNIPLGAVGYQTIVTQNGRTVAVAYVAQPAEQARPSHDWRGNPTPGYDQGLQPRARNLPQYQRQAQNYARDLDFSKAAFFPETTIPATTADIGAPVMTADGDTLTGNGREIAIRLAYQEGGEASRWYKVHFIQKAFAFGLDKAVVSAMRQPILKRVILEPLSREELIRFSQESNEKPGMEQNALEMAGQDAGRLTPQLLSLFDPNYAIDSARNAEFVRAYAENVIGGAEGTEANLTRSDLTRRIRMGIFAYAYGMDEAGRAAIERMAGDESDGGGKTITNGLLTVAPIVARMKTDIASADLHPLDLSPAISRAAQDISEALRNRPAKQSADVALEGMLRQEGLFGGDPLTRAVTEFLVRNRTNRGEIEDTLSRYVETVYKLGNPKEGDLFGERQIPSTLEVFERAASDPGTLRSQPMDQNDRRPVSMPPAVIASPLGTVRNHPDYQAAKAGDTRAAFRVVRDIVTPDFIARVRSLIDNESPVIVPVLAIEQSGMNKLPNQGAVRLKTELGLAYTDSIVQAERANRSSMSGLDRVFKRVRFQGEVTPGQSYLLLDDTLTQGGTLADLASFIEARGGRVIGAVALTGHQYSALLTPSHETLGQLRQLHGGSEDAFRQATGYGFDHLTESEARTLLKWRPADAVRNRILAERDARVVSQRGGTDRPGEGGSGESLGSGVAPDRPEGDLRSQPTEIDAAARDAATSPTNDLPEPTPAQKEAGNYRKGHVRIGGLDLSIENPAGSRRRPEWPELTAHYGYVKGTEGKDGDHVDVFIKPGTPEGWNGAVFVVNQIDPKTGRFDEHKAVIGAGNREEAEALYRSNYSPGWKGFGGMAAMPLEEFKAWAKDGVKSAPATERTPAARLKEGWPLVEKIAAGYANIPGVELADVQQTARIALLRAAQTYRAESGAPFEAFARRAMNNALRDLYRGRARSREETTLDAPLSPGENETGRDLVPDRGLGVREEVERREAARLISESVEELPARLKEAITGILSGRTLEEIGQEFGGMTKQGVARLAAMGMQRLRGKLGERGVRGSNDLLRSQPIGGTEGPFSNKPFKEQLMDLQRGELSPNTMLSTGWTPKLLRTLGAPDLRVVIAQSTIKKVWDEKHGVPMRLLADLPEALEKPLLIHRSTTQPGAVMVFVPLELKERNLAVALHLSRQEQRILVHRIASISDRSDFQIQQALNQPGLIYLDEKNAPEWLKLTGVQFPGVSTLKERNPNLRTSSDLVNRLSSQPLDDLDDAIRTNIKAQETGDPLEELLALLDTDALDNLQAKAASERPGDRTIGRPDLALGAESPAMMGVDEHRKTAVRPESDGEWQRDGEAMLARDYEGTVNLLARRALETGGTLNPPETKAAQMIVAREMARPLTPERQKRVQAILWAYRETGTAAGRTLASRVDPFKTPVERHREFLAKAIFTPPAKTRAAIEAAATPAEKQRLLDADMERVNRVKAELSKMGVSFDDILAGEVNLRLKGAPVVQNILSSFDEKRQKAFRLLQGGQTTFAEVAKQTGLSEAELKKVKADFIEEFRRKHFEKFKKGLKADAVDASGLSSQPTEETTVDDAAAEAEFQKALAMMGIVDDAKQGRMKVVRRKRKLFRPPPAPTPGAFAAPLDTTPRRQGNLDMTLPEGNADRSPAGVMPVGEPGKKQGELSLPKPDWFDAPTPPPAGLMPTHQGELALPKDATFDQDAWYEAMVQKGADLGDAVDVARLARVAQAASGNRFDMLYEYWINGILSGPATHVANIAGNAVSTGWDFTVQRGMEALLNLVYRDANAASFGEFRHLARGLLPGFQRGLRLAMKAWNAEADFFEHDVLNRQVELLQHFEKGGGVAAAIPGKAGRSIRIPGRALLFMDSLFKGLIAQMEVGAQAYRIAKGEGLSGDSRLFLPAGTAPYPELEKADRLLLAWNRQHPSESWAPQSPPNTYTDMQGKTQKMTGEQYSRFTAAAGKRVRELLAGRIGEAQIRKSSAHWRHASRLVWGALFRSRKEYSASSSRAFRVSTPTPI